MRPVYLLVLSALTISMLAGGARADGHKLSTTTFEEGQLALEASVRRASQTLDGLRVYRVLVASASASNASPGTKTKTAGTFFTTQQDALSAQAPGDVVAAIQHGATELADKFALAKLIGQVGGQLELIDDPAAAKIVLATEKAEQLASYTSGLLGLAATALSFVSGHEGTAAGLAGGASLVLGAGGVRSGNKADDTTKGNQAAVNTGLEQTMAKARTVADKLSVYAYFSIELRSLNASLSPIEKELGDLADNVPDPTDAAKVALYASNYVAAFARVDAFYDNDLPKLQALVADRKNSSVYTEATKASLDSLSTVIADSMTRWGKARVIYLESQTIATEYLANAH